MRVVISLLKDVKDKKINRGDAGRILYEYKNARNSNPASKWATDEGKFIKLQFQKFEDVIKKVGIVHILQHLDNMTRYPLVVDGVNYDMSQKDELLEALIKQIEKDTK